MKKQNGPMLQTLDVQEARNISGGYAPPTEEQMEALREIYGPLADYIICW